MSILRTYNVQNPDSAPTNIELSADGGISVAGIVTANGGLTVNAGASVSGVITATGGIVVAAGSTSAPSISPSGDSNTGIFFPSADTIAVSYGGTEALRIKDNGYVGIGTDNPLSTLHLVSPSSTDYKNLVISRPIANNTANGGVISGARYENSNVPFTAFGMWDSGAERVAYMGGGGWSAPASTELRFSTAPSYTETADADLLRMRIDSGGRVTTPYQPSFYTIGTNYTQVTGTSIIIPNVVSYNLGSHYNGTTGRFTAPIAGRYIFGFWGLSYPHNTEVNNIQGFVNGSGAGQLVQFGGAAHLHIQATGNLLLNLNANDIFDWRYTRGSGTATAYGSQWNMWGYLLG